jgi:hypothetical protein
VYCEIRILMPQCMTHHPKVMLMVVTPVRLAPAAAINRSALRGDDD